MTQGKSTESPCRKSQIYIKKQKKNKNVNRTNQINLKIKSQMTAAPTEFVAF